MAPGGKINKPKTVPRKDLGKNIFKRRRVLSKRKHQKHKITGAKIASTIEELGLIATHPLKKSSTRDNITVSGKQRRKLLKKIKHMEKEKASMDVEAPSKSRKLANTMEVEPVAPQKKAKKVRTAVDVEMQDSGPQEGE